VWDGLGRWGWVRASAVVNARSAEGIAGLEPPALGDLERSQHAQKEIAGNAAKDKVIHTMALHAQHLALAMDTSKKMKGR
jgi:hypothetical protein